MAIGTRLPMPVAVMSKVYIYTAACLLGLWAQIMQRAQMFVCVSVV